MTEQQQYYFTLWDAISQFMPDFWLEEYEGDYTQEYLQQQGYPYSEVNEMYGSPGYDWEIWQSGGGDAEGGGHEFGDYDWLSPGADWVNPYGKQVPWANFQFSKWIGDWGSYLPSSPTFEEQNKIISNANLDELSMYLRAAQQDVNTISNLNAISDFTDVGGGVGDINIKLAADAQLASIDKQRKKRRNWRDFYDDLYSSIGDIAFQGAFTEDTIQDLYAPTYDIDIPAGPGGSSAPYEWTFGELPTYDDYCDICPSCCD